MPFMVPEIIQGMWYMVDGDMGTEWVLAELVGDQYTQNWQSGDPIPEPLAGHCENNEAYEIELKEGYGARLQAPGYMDTTDLSVFDTKEEAEKYIAETYEVCAKCGKDLYDHENDKDMSGKPDYYCVDCGEET